AVPLMSGKGGTNLAKFAELVQQMAHEAQILSLPELIEHVIHHSGLRAHYQGEREGADRLENLQELVNAAAVFSAEENFEGLPAGRTVVGGRALSSVEAAADSRGESGAQGFDVDSPFDEQTMSPLAAFLSHAS